LPPGTGDAQLTMAQQVPLAGAVIVSTPQDIAVLDARKGLNMFTKVEVPVVGIVENMSYFLCPHCGGRSEIFSHGGARQEAERLGTEFLGEVPLDLKIREASDGGTPITVADPDHPHALVFRHMAARIWDKVAGAGAERRAPSAAEDRHRIGKQSSTFASGTCQCPASCKVPRAIFETLRDFLYGL
jgi:ATP-binding protein involved in chromosome partitioning